nr:ribonuclease H-like domain-containing protein [Tanacetum cinerariifolium]
NLNNNVNAAKANSVNTAKGNKVTGVVGNQGINAVKSSACWGWRPKIKVQDHVSQNSGSYICKQFDYGAPQDALKDQEYFDSACSSHMTGNISYLTDLRSMMDGMLPSGEELNVIRLLAKAPSELMCDKKNSVLFTDTECFVLSPNFKLAEESQVLLKVPRKNNMYSFDMKNIVPQKDLTCLLAKATNDESMLSIGDLANSVNTAKGNKVTGVVGNQGINAVKSSACWGWRPKIKVQDHVSQNSGSYICKQFDYGAPQDALKDQEYFDSACSSHMTGNISYLTDLRSMMDGMLPSGEELNVIRLLAKAPSELMCDKKNSVLFTDTECFVLSPNFKLAEESQVLLKVPRKNNMYSFDMKNIVPQKDLTCLLAKATNDESMLSIGDLVILILKILINLLRIIL